MDAPPELDGRVALVSGGTRGIGRGITDRLLAAGAQVAVCARSQPEELPAGARFFLADVRDPAQNDRLVAAVVDHYGRLEILINNAGGSPRAEAASAAPSFSTAIVNLNLMAPLLVSQAANRVMQAQADGGAIVNLGSLHGPAPAAGAAAYGAAKAGLVDLTRSLAVEWAPKVRVNCVSAGHLAPPPTDGSADTEARARTAVTVPIGRPGSADDVAEAVCFLASPASAYVTGSNLMVHGGEDRPAYLAAITGE